MASLEGPNAMINNSRLTPIEKAEKLQKAQSLLDAARESKRTAAMAAEKIKAAKRREALKIVPVEKAGAKKKGVKKKAKAATSEEAAAADETATAASASASASAEEEEEEEPVASAPSASEPATTQLSQADIIAANDDESEALRERLWAEREQQRREVMAAIVEEERRQRKLAMQRRERQLAEKRLQKSLHDASYEGRIDEVQSIVTKWCQECFSDLIGAKLDCTDHEGNTPLSEAACGGHPEICLLLLKHGADVNKRSEQGRTPLWRAAFMDHEMVCTLLLKHGGDPRIPSHNLDHPELVAPSASLKELLSSWSDEEVDRLLLQREEALADQWRPPPEDEEEEAPCGEPGFSLSITLTKLADALDAVGRDTDRYSLVIDLGGKVTTYLSYRDTNMAMAYRPYDTDPVILRRLLLGALRYGKPFVLDMLSMPLTYEAVSELLDPVMPGLLKLLLNRKIREEQHYSQLIRDGDEEEYSNLTLWKESNLDYFHFILLSRLPVAPQWCVDSLFVIKVASAMDDETAMYT